MNRIIWPAFLLLVLAQWIVPVSMIWKSEKILRVGKNLKFLTAPVDPEDPFRGRYIILDFKENGKKVKGRPYETGEEIYVTFGRDNEGYATVDQLLKEKPRGNEYLKTTVSYSNSGDDSSFVFINYPFNTFYMEESKAPEAERIYRQRNLDSLQKTYALVSIFDGTAVIRDVYINDSTISDVIRNRRALR